MSLFLYFKFRYKKWIPSGLLLILFLFSSLYVHQRRYDSQTPVSRLNLLHAVVSDGVLYIDKYTNTFDRAYYDGHYYSDKAPGTVALALLPFWIGSLAMEEFDIDIESSEGWLYSSWITTFLVNGVPSAIGTVLLFRMMLWWVPYRIALLTVTALYLGAAPLPYSTMLFSHSLVFGMICISLYCIEVVNRITSQVSITKFYAGPCWRSFGPPIDGTVRVHAFFGGLSAGIALASEYTSGIVVAGLFWSIFYHSRRAAFIFGISAILPLSTIPIYSHLCFSNPWILPYSYQAHFPEMKKGVYAIQWPDSGTFLKLLFSPARGLFFWSPFLLLWCFSFNRVFALGKGRWFLFLGIPILQTIIISGRVWDWPAGDTLGPRYLVPMLPLLALPCALVAMSKTWTACALATLSIAMTTVATLTDACPSYATHDNPFLSLHLPYLFRGEFSPNLGVLLGLSAAGSIAVYYGVLGLLYYMIWGCSRLNGNGKIFHNPKGQC